MDLKEFESLVEGSQESQSLDYKAGCAWNAVSLAKDILAFSNIQDGGYIVFGFDDGSFDRIGVSNEDAETFQLETMQDQMAEFADPYVKFDVHNNIFDENNKRFIVIRVYEFDEVPIVCRKDSSDTHKGKMYYRSQHRRVESSAVSNSYDMRDILDRATFKLMAKRQSQGFAPQSSDVSEIYNDELGGL